MSGGSPCGSQDGFLGCVYQPIGPRQPLEMLCLSVWVFQGVVRSGDLIYKADHQIWAREWIRLLWRHRSILTQLSSLLGRPQLVLGHSSWA